MTSEAAPDAREEAALAEVLERAYDALLEVPAGALVPTDGFAEAARAVFSGTWMDGWLRPAARQAARDALEVLSLDETCSSRYLGPRAVDSLCAVARASGGLPDALVRHVCEHEAAETVLRDVLSRGLREFNEKVNPVFAEWGLPALLKRIVPLGFGAVMKSLEAARAELDRRLEPELAKFVTVFTRKALKGTADFVIAHQGDPAFVALRESTLRFAAELAVSAWPKRAERSIGELAADAVVDALASTSEDTTRQARVDLVGRWARVAEGTSRGRTLGDWLAAAGATERPPFRAWARLGLPLWRVLASHEPFIRAATGLLAARAAADSTPS
jgi:hypothetical protein